MKFTTTFKRSLLAVASLGAFASFQVEASTLIQHVRVFDGERMLPARHVLIDQGKIVDANYKGKINSDMKLIDGKGRSLLPGLIDAHVHAYQDQDLPLLFGVTSHIDMFSAVEQMQGVKKRMANGTNKSAPDLFSSGTLATAPKGHGTEYGMTIETLVKPEEAQAWVDKRVAEGSDFIKIVMEHGSERYAFNSLDLATVQALIKASHARNKLAVVHISTYDDARAALAAGADGLVHLYNGAESRAEQTKELITLAKKHKAFVIPTLSVLESVAGIKADDILQDASLTSLLSKAQLATLNTTYGKITKPELLAAPSKLSAALHAAGIPVLAGTDAGNSGTMHGISVHHEMAALVKAGLSPNAALSAATAAPAKAFRLADRGRIAKGLKADLLLVEGDPSIQIQDSRRIVEIWKDGEIVSPLRAEKRDQVLKAATTKKLAIALPQDGRISQFSASKFASPFGLGWFPTNDSPMGGKSSVALQVGELDPTGQTALLIKANVQPGFAFPWAGVVFFPAQQAMQPADLSNANTLKFKVKGDGKKYQVGFTMQTSFIPTTQSFTADAEWKEISLPFSAFKGLDASIVTMLSFNAGPESGGYQFQIADVRLVRE